MPSSGGYRRATATPYPEVSKMIASDAWKFKIERTGKRIVQELGDSSKLRCFAYQNCKRFPKDYWLAFPARDSATLGRKFYIASETIRYVICDASDAWKQLLTELDCCVQAMSVAFLCNDLGFKQREASPTVPSSWLDFLVEYGMVSSQVFQLHKNYDPIHPISIAVPDFKHGNVGVLSQYGVKSVRAVEGFDSGWITDDFDVVAKSIDAIEELLNTPLVEKDDNQDCETFSFFQSRKYSTSEILAERKKTPALGGNKKKKAPLFSHSDDFSSIIVDGVSYPLGTEWLRNGFEFLWERTQAGSPNVDVEVFRLSMHEETPPHRWDYAFKDLPEIRTLIAKPIRNNGKEIKAMVCLSFWEKIGKT
jgi:hypothetical protein